MNVLLDNVYHTVLRFKQQQCSIWWDHYQWLICGRCPGKSNLMQGSANHRCQVTTVWKMLSWQLRQKIKKKNVSFALRKKKAMFTRPKNQKWHHGIIQGHRNEHQPSCHHLALWQATTRARWIPGLTDWQGTTGKRWNGGEGHPSRHF